MRKKIFGIIYIISVLVVVLCACTNREAVYLTDTEEVSETEKSTPDTEEEPAFCCVYICGAVRKPGVYRLQQGARVCDAVEAAGGFTEDALQTACNLAEYVVDEQQITIPTKEEAAQQSSGEDEQNMPDGRINLNTATAAQLMELPGIGAEKAESILSYRQEHGRYEKTEDIMNITGIKNGIYEKIKDRIAVN